MTHVPPFPPRARCRVQPAAPTSWHSAVAATAVRASRTAGRKAKLKEISYG
jgi:hypothetical protein